MRWLSSVRLPAEAGLWRIGVDRDGLISSVRPLEAGSTAAGENWEGDWLSPMGTDLQINGGLGLAFPELTSDDLPRLVELLELLWRDGVEAIAPTLVTCGVAELRQALSVLQRARSAHQPGRCRLLGAHLEGPFLAEERRGAHPGQHLAAPSLEALRARIDGFSGGPNADIALMTLAPELDGAAEVIDALRAQGILVSLGHSTANESQAEAAFAQGVGMITHAFNAMPGLHHRAPGPIAAAARRGDVALGLIADGVHVAPSMAVLLQRLAPEQVVLVSDALAPYGLSDGVHRWDERTLIVENGSCRLEDGTLAGVTLPLLEAVRRLAAWGGDADQAIAAATVLPRWVLGVTAPLHNQLIGAPLNHTLRWSARAGGLHWQRVD
jgi:N-acetylglucosamine-6-phosphate deacetylase